MDALRRLKYIPTRTGKRASLVRDEDRRPARLPGPAGRMYNALNQMRAGIPLNWLQIEDDPELATLAAVQAPAELVRATGQADPPAEVRALVLERMSARLPAARTAPVKEPPKPLAGFSEAVPVLTQEDDVIPPLIPAQVQWVLGTVAAALLVFLVFSTLSSFIKASTALRFSWVEVRDGDKLLSRVERPASWQPSSCPNRDRYLPPGESTFRGIPSLSYAQQNAGFPIATLPVSMTLPSTYTMRLMDVAISPCDDELAVGDPNATVRTEYQVRHELESIQAVGPDGTPISGPGTVPLGITRLVIFHSRQLPAVISATTGTWHEVKVGDFHGVHWQGFPYRDPEGVQWIGEVSALTVERGDVVMTLVGRADEGMTEEVMTELIKRINLPVFSTPEASGQTGLFTWIEVRNRSDVLSPRQLSPAWQVRRCDTVGTTSAQSLPRFRPAENLVEMRAQVGFPVLLLPDEIAGPTMKAAPGSSDPGVATRYTFSLAEISVRPCNTRQTQAADLGGRVKLRYLVHLNLASGQRVPVSDITVFEAYQQPATIDVGTAQTETVTVGNTKGIRWKASDYQDMSGIEYDNDIHVLVVERGDVVVTLLGSAVELTAQEYGVTPDLLLNLAKQMK